jgi:hypothetical protein
VQSLVCILLDRNTNLGSYAYIERSYDDSEAESSSKKRVSEPDESSPSPPPESKLEPSVQQLMRLIFNVAIM